MCSLENNDLRENETISNRKTVLYLIIILSQITYIKFLVNIKLNGKRLENVKRELKENTTNYKKRLFDEFANQTLNGLKKINLNNFTNDPSLLHDVISNKLFRDCGIFAPRTSYVKLWVDNEYIGLYLTIENVDKTFLK